MVQYNGQLYDPSYGAGPFPSIRAWAKASLAGYMTFQEKALKNNKLVYLLQAHNGICNTPCGR